jgi:hypothetical protein
MRCTPFVPTVALVFGLVGAACGGSGKGEGQARASAATAATAPPATQASARSSDSGAGPGLRAESTATQVDSADCVRDQPDTLFARGSDFRRIGPREALEAVRTAGPTGLTVRHFGCTHYALTFNFTWSTAQAAPGAALSDAARLLETLPVRADYGGMVKSLVAGMRVMAARPSGAPHQLSETETLTVTRDSARSLTVRYDNAL